MSAPEKSPDNLPGPLAGLRVLELADEKGQFCGKLLADHDADVIKIEPPGGCGVRRVGPFLDDVPHPDRSLTFWYYNTSKRGITLDLERAEGARLFRRLAAGADVILETWAPGRLIELGLGYEALSKDNPGLIVCSLTPFGQTGPWRDYKSSDLVHMLVKASARKPMVIALDTPVTDHPVSRVMAPRNTGSENIAPIATQPSRPPAATITQRY